MAPETFETPVEEPISETIPIKELEPSVEEAPAEETEVSIVQVVADAKLATETGKLGIREEELPCEETETSSPLWLNEDKLEVPSLRRDSGTHSYTNAIEIHSYKDLDTLSSTSFQF